MELTPEDIKIKRLVGKTPNGFPVYHVLTKGGFNIIMRKLPDGGGWQVLGKGHPFAVAKHMAEQIEKNIIWDESLNKSEDFNPPMFLEKAEDRDDSGNKIYESNPENHYKLAAHHAKMAGKSNHKKLGNEKRLNEFHENVAYPHFMQEKKAEAAGIPFEKMPESYQKARKIVSGLRAKLESSHHDLGMKSLMHSDTALKHFKAAGLDHKQAKEEFDKHSVLHHELKDDEKAPFDDHALQLAWHRKHLEEKFPNGLES